MKQQIIETQVVVMVGDSIHAGEKEIFRNTMKLPKLYSGKRDDSKDDGNMPEIAASIIDRVANDGLIIGVDLDLLRIYVNGITLPRRVMAQRHIDVVQKSY